MTIALLMAPCGPAVGRPTAAETTAEEWAEKIRRYAPLTDNRVRPNPKNAASADIAVQVEGQRVLRLLSMQARQLLPFEASCKTRLV